MCNFVVTPRFITVSLNLEFFISGQIFVYRYVVALCGLSVNLSLLVEDGVEVVDFGYYVKDDISSSMARSLL